MAKKKYYVIWKGKETGVFTSWDRVKKLVQGFEGAQYKSFTEKKEADIAFKKSYKDYKGKTTKKPTLSAAEKAKYGSPIENTLTVDAACSGNPGKMEYRGVLNSNKQEVFKKGPYKGGTNNIGEFLALVHGIALLKKKGLHKMPIYSDSKIAMSWVKKKECRTNIAFDSSNKELLDLITRAEKWLKENSYQNPIIKWETKAWGEIPADFGRK
ncbi:ribonuclease H family protein [Pseudotenacibaculum sp. MALMAid0570]|uniref:ribonuclease H family protein n=1 Tax=Pseudotenacibaculum sp. MALMAid0570 TaxID=3143938 RepID=UPI0032DFAEF8